MNEQKTLNDLVDSQMRKIQRLQREIKRLERIVAQTNNGSNTAVFGVPDVRYVAEAYGSNGRWLIRDTDKGAIVAYPGPGLADVAKTWLRHETAAAGPGEQACSLRELTCLVEVAEQRIAQHLELV